MRYGDRFLAGVGIATVLADFDFETYSEAGFVWNEAEQKYEQLPGIAPTKRKGLPTVGLYNYARHPTFEVLSLAYDLKNGNGPRFWRPGFPDPTDLFEHLAQFPRHDPGAAVRYDVPGLIEAWRCSFELEAWAAWCAARGWPSLLPEQVRCAMSKAKCWGYPGALANAGPALYLPPEYVKDPKGEKLIGKLTVPKAPSKKDRARRWTRITAPREFAAFDAYNVQDIIAESQISIRIPDLPRRELEIWQFDQQCNRRGMAIAVDDVEAMITIVEQCIDRGNSRLRYITGGQVSGYSKQADLLAWLRTQSVYLDELDEDTVAAALENKDRVTGYAREALEIRAALSFGSVKKLYSMRVQTGADGRLRGQYDYAGAHTRLWNGQNVQVANLYKGSIHRPEDVDRALAVIRSGSLEYVEGVYGDALQVVADCLRSMIVAPPGHDLIAADFSSIQAVVTGALAGEEWRNEVFHTHGQMYYAMASQLTGKPLDWYLAYKRETGQHHEDRQTFGKIPVLSADFGAWVTGWKKFDPKGLLGDDQNIKRMILQTRDRIPRIVEMWGGQVRNKFRDDERPELYGFEGCAISAVKEPGKCFGYRGVRFMMHGDALYVQPPHDGAPLVYHEPRLETARREWARPYELALSYMGWNSSQTKGRGGWVRMSLYGGLITQNVVANVSREFQANALVALEKTGIYLPVMHTHDEAVCEVREGIGSVDEFLAVYDASFPAWAVHIDGPYKGKLWPVKVPGAERTKRYGKWE
jgi:DNA polymerase